MSSALASSLSTLERIRIKTRRLTGTPSQNQLSDTELDDYINTFFLFDFPETLRTFNLRETYEFYTEPNVEAYAFPSNEFTNIYQPVYIAGYQAFYTQSREQFYRIYPQLQFITAQAVGDGTAGPYSLQLPQTPVLRGFSYPPGNLPPFSEDNPMFSQILVSGVGTGNVAVIARDDGNGGFVNESGTPLVGTIDYLTGAITGLEFDAPINASSEITAQAIPYEPSRPEAMLFFDDTIVIRPVPDKSYQVSLEVQKRPTALLSSGQNPELEEWWQFLAYGAAKKILEDRQDSATLGAILPGFKEQERLVLRRTSDQLAQERTATIFTEQVQYPWGNFFNRF